MCFSKYWVYSQEVYITLGLLAINKLNIFKWYPKYKLVKYNFYDIFKSCKEPLHAPTRPSFSSTLVSHWIVEELAPCLSVETPC